jgi:hypothetical protein
MPSRYPLIGRSLLSHFAPRGGLVTLRQTFVGRRHGGGNRPRLGDNLMLSKLSIIGAVAAILMIPTALSAQMGGAVNPGVHVGGAVNPGAAVRGAVVQGIPGPDFGTWRWPSGAVHRSRKHSKAVTKQRR